MMGHKICFKGVLGEIIPELSLLPLLIWSTELHVFRYHYDEGTLSRTQLYNSASILNAQALEV